MKDTIRRAFLHQSGMMFLAAGILFGATTAFAKTEAKRKPNILLIITDQQHARMMSCAGNKWLKTPDLDGLAKEGIA